ncbi:MAG: GntR family transcriptional regulator [Treponema sp.]|jgi:DNA-binding LacI/PurR family transcriptional regulator|nr:GntR family transcriptional regulator [Treponema sp.]
MKNHNNESESGPLYKHIYNQILEDITTGKLSPGDRTPSEKELCETFGVSRITSKKALEMLADQGIIIRRPGMGSFVAEGDAQEDVSSARTIGFLISDFNDTFGTRLIYSVEEACSALGYHMILKRTRESQDEEKKALRSLIDENVAGILMIPVHGEYYNGEILKQMLHKRPFVFVDRKMPGLPVPTVSTDTITASVTAVKQLLDLGHRNIAFFSRSVQHTSTIEDRRYGFIKAFSDYGLPFTQDCFCPPLVSSNDIGMVTRYLMEHPEITAAFTSEFEIALLVKIAAESMNRRIPQDFSIITFDSPQYISDFTYIKQDEYTMGKKAVEILHRIISGNAAVSVEDILLPAELISGNSIQAIN